jgi:hypothetical protein
MPDIYGQGGGGIDGAGKQNPILTKISVFRALHLCLPLIKSSTTLATASYMLSYYRD